MKYIGVILVSIFLFSCSKSKDEKTPQILDTSFLELGKPGESSVSSTFKPSSSLHILKTDQNISIDDDKNGIISITNFSFNSLNVDDVIVGNEKDRYLFKVTSLENNQIRVKLGNLGDLSNSEKNKVQFKITPLIDYKLENERVNLNNEYNIQQMSQSKAQKTENRVKLENIILFESPNISVRANNISQRKTKLNFSHGGKIKVTLDEGELQIIPTFKGDIDYNWFKVNKVESSIDTLIKYKFKITVENESQTSGTVLFPIFKDLKFPVRAMLGPVPIWIDVVIQFNAGVKLGIENGNKTTFEVQSEYALKGSTYYTPKTGATFDTNKDYLVRARHLEVKQENSTVSTEFFLEPKIQTLIYKVLGPYAAVRAGIEGRFQTPLQPGEDDLFINLSGRVGLSVVEPLFDSTLLDIKSPNLFELSKGWDIIGPKGEKQTLPGIPGETQRIEADKLENNRLAIDLRPEIIDPLTKIVIQDQPNFGRLVKHSEFEINGIVYYYPPHPMVEGDDSFSIQYVNKGQTSAPQKIELELGENARKQLNDKPISLSGSLNALSEVNETEQSIQKTNFLSLKNSNITLSQSQIVFNNNFIPLEMIENKLYQTALKRSLLEDIEFSKLSIYQCSNSKTLPILEGIIESKKLIITRPDQLREHLLGVTNCFDYKKLEKIPFSFEDYQVDVLTRFNGDHYEYLLYISSLGQLESNIELDGFIEYHLELNNLSQLLGFEHEGFWSNADIKKNISYSVNYISSLFRTASLRQYAMDSLRRVLKLETKSNRISEESLEKLSKMYEIALRKNIDFISWYENLEEEKMGFSFSKKDEKKEKSIANTKVQELSKNEEKKIFRKKVFSN